MGEVVLRNQPEADLPTLGFRNAARLVEPKGLWQGFVDGIRRMFMAPHFAMNSVNNHYLGGVSNADIPDTDINESLYCYIRVHMHVHYKVAGRENRDLRLEHCRKLALRWAAQNKIPTPTIALDTNWYVKTIQIACDQAENALLYSYVDPNYSFSLAWVAFYVLVLPLLLLFGIYGVVFVATVMGYSSPMEWFRAPHQLVSNFQPRGVSLQSLLTIIAELAVQHASRITTFLLSLYRTWVNANRNM